MQKIYIELTTANEEPIQFEMNLTKIENFLLVTHQVVNLNITPSQPYVLQYNMKSSMSAVRIEVESNSSNCMLLGVQDLQCPFYDTEKTIAYSGFYQTLTKQAGVYITRNIFEGQVYIVLVQSIADKCVNADDAYKEITLSFSPTATDSEAATAISLVLIIYGVVCLIAFLIMLDWKKLCIGDEEANSKSVVELSSRSRTWPADDAQTFTTPPTSLNINSASENDQDNPEIALQTRNDETDLKKRNIKKSEVFTWNLFIVAVFYGLPAGQVAFINQKNVYLTGNQDLCYYNYLCSYHWLGFFFDFNHVFSNIGYIILGGLFIYIVRQRKKTTTPEQFSLNPRQAKGLYIHFGIQYAMGIALIMEGVLSGFYHLCPNEQDFQFDLTFMYVICVLSMMFLHQARHPILTDKPHSTFFILAVLIFVCVCGTLFPGLATYVFWSVFAIVHIATMIILSAKVYYRHDSSKRTVFRRPCYNPCSIKNAKYKGRAVFLIFVWIINVAIHLYLLVKGLNTLGDLLLNILILNTGLYLLYYWVLKCYNKEGVCCTRSRGEERAADQSEDGCYNTCKTLSPWMPWIYLLLCLIFGCFAIFYYNNKRTDWQAAPAESRELNSHCLVGNFYDEHDLWHFLSSFAVFFLFLTLITLDDDRTDVPRSKIAMF